MLGGWRECCRCRQRRASKCGRCFCWRHRRRIWRGRLYLWFTAAKSVDDFLVVVAVTCLEIL
jgi:hypothetical protein